MGVRIPYTQNNKHIRFRDDDVDGNWAIITQDLCGDGMGKERERKRAEEWKHGIVQ